MPNLKDPLSAEQKKDILDGIAEADQLIEAINTAQSANVPVGDRLASVKAMREDLIRLKNTYIST